MIGLACLRREPRNGAANVGLFEGRGLVDFAGEEAFTEGAEGDEADAELFESGKDLLFGRPVPERVLALQRGNRLHGVGAADGFGAGFRKTEMLHLALLDQVLDGAGHVFDGYRGVDAVLVVEVDDINAEALKRTLKGL